jgi:serpin B
MERDSEDIRYHAGDGFRMADLGYGGDAFAMTIVVPEGDGTPEALLADLDASTWNGWIAGLQETRTMVTLPRFELDWESDLNDALKALGMVDAFDPGAADFSRLIQGGGVWVDRVFQKSAVSVDELGTTASAVTGVILRDSAPPSVRADRPFLFVLRERLSGTILFMGIVNDPVG